MGIEITKANLPQEVRQTNNSARANASDKNFDFLDALNASAEPLRPIEKSAAPKTQNINKKNEANPVSLEDENGEIPEEKKENSEIANAAANAIPFLLANLTIVASQNNGQNSTPPSGEIVISSEIVISGDNLEELNSAIAALKLGQTDAALQNQKVQKSQTGDQIVNSGENVGAQITAQNQLLETEADIEGNPQTKGMIIGQTDLDPQSDMATLLNKLGVDKLGVDKLGVDKLGEIKLAPANGEKPNDQVKANNSAAQFNIASDGASENGAQMGGQNNAQRNGQSNSQSNAQGSNQNGQNLALNSTNSQKAANLDIKSEKLDNAKANAQMLETLSGTFDQLAQTNSSATDASLVQNQTSDAAKINMPALAAMIAKKHFNGEKSIFVRLDPAELGGVRIELKFGANKKLSAIINVEKPEALRELSNNSANLLQSLRDSGLDVAENAIEFQLDFSPNEQNQPQNWAAQNSNKNANATANNGGELQSQEAIIGANNAQNQNIITPHLEIWKRARISLEA